MYVGYDVCCSYTAITREEQSCAVLLLNTPDGLYKTRQVDDFEATYVTGTGEQVDIRSLFQTPKTELSLWR